MKILMLGHSGVGKTTYIASMYGAMQFPVAGFSITADRSEDNARLLGLHSDIRRGAYPSMSNQRDSYPFRLLYERVDVLSFEWTDYRGGALQESARSSEQAQTLHEDLKNADAVLAFFDCTALKRGSAASQREIRRMIALLSRATAETNRLMPLVLVLAKADLVTLSGEILHPLEGLLDAMKASKHVAGAVVPVSCGQNAANVAAPALFALYFGLRQRMDMIGEQINAMAAERDKMNQRVSTLWDWAADWVDSKLSGVSTWGELAEAKHNALLTEYRVLQRLEAPSDILAKHLDGDDDVITFGGFFAKEAA